MEDAGCKSAARSGLEWQPDKWSMPLPLIETVKTQRVREVRWSEKSKDDGSSIGGQS